MITCHSTLFIPEPAEPEHKSSVLDYQLLFRPPAMHDNAIYWCHFAHVLGQFIFFFLTINLLHVLTLYKLSIPVLGS